MTSLEPLLRPRTIAVLGASRNPGTIGHEILSNLIAFGYSGAVYPVNPKAKAICSVKAYPGVAEIPDQIDLGVIVVPRDHVLASAHECVAAGARALMVVSAGFKEMNGKGAALEQELVDLVRRHGIRLLGPNCLGVINTDPAVSMNATFVSATPPYGHAAFVSQSGALGASVLDHAREFGIGIAQFVSVGNKADISSNDLLLEWKNDPAIRVILMYVENFGNPRRFLEIAKELTKTKPIIAVKSGRSMAGARAASSHTGALMASDTAVDALLTQAGVLRADSVEELFDLAMAFGARAAPRSRRTAILTNAGGPGILAADALERQGLDVVELSPQTVEILRPIFPAEASLRNPLDMIASATPAGYGAALSAILRDPQVDAVVPIFVPPLRIRQEEIAQAIAGASNIAPEKPILAVLMGREGLPEGRADLGRAGIPTFVFPESAARALAALNRHHEWATKPVRACAPLSVNRLRAEAVIAASQAAGEEWLVGAQALDVLCAYGIQAASSALAESADEAADRAQALGYPVAMKAAAAGLIHKSDAGGVTLNVRGEDQVRAAYERLVAAQSRHASAGQRGRVLIQQMVDGDWELAAGIARDPSFGPLVMFGLGGVLVEALGDVVFRLAPLDDGEALAMVDAIRGAAVFRGTRGRPPVDRAVTARVLRGLAQLADDFPQITELDVNPLCAAGDSVVAVDARIRLSPVCPDSNNSSRERTSATNR